LLLTDKGLIPQWPFLENFREQERAMKEKQKEKFDSRHREIYRLYPRIQKFGLCHQRTNLCKIE
jgi:hypothetical protein